MKLKYITVFLLLMGLVFFQKKKNQTERFFQAKRNGFFKTKNKKKLTRNGLFSKNPNGMNFHQTTP